MNSALYSGAGNTFVIIDHRTPFLPYEKMGPIAKQEGVDGTILVENSKIADAAMRIFNPDGSEAEMCGNGLRCFIHFLNALGLRQSIYHIETLAGIQKGWLDERGVCVQLTPPRHLQLHVESNLHFLNTGVPHAVTFVEDIEKIDVESLGRQLRFSKHFAPKGANVNFVTLSAKSKIFLRTYERGVERETLACGTGAVAAALITHKLYHLPSPLSVFLRSGDLLDICFNQDWSEIQMSGPIQQFDRLYTQKST